MGNYCGCQKNSKIRAIQTCEDSQNVVTSSHSEESDATPTTLCQPHSNCKNLEKTTDLSPETAGSESASLKHIINSDDNMTPCLERRTLHRSISTELVSHNTLIEEDGDEVPCLTPCSDLPFEPYNHGVEQNKNALERTSKRNSSRFIFYKSEYSSSYDVKRNNNFPVGNGRKRRRTFEDGGKRTTKKRRPVGKGNNNSPSHGLSSLSVIKHSNICSSVQPTSNLHHSTRDRIIPKFSLFSRQQSPQHLFKSKTAIYGLDHNSYCRRHKGLHTNYERQKSPHIVKKLNACRPCDGYYPLSAIATSVITEAFDLPFFSDANDTILSTSKIDAIEDFSTLKCPKSIVETPSSPIITPTSTTDGDDNFSEITTQFSQEATLPHNGSFDTIPIEFSTIKDQSRRNEVPPLLFEISTSDDNVTVSANNTPSQINSFRSIDETDHIRQSNCNQTISTTGFELDLSQLSVHGFQANQQTPDFDSSLQNFFRSPATERRPHLDGYELSETQHQVKQRPATARPQVFCNERQISKLFRNKPSIKQSIISTRHILEKTSSNSCSSLSPTNAIPSLAINAPLSIGEC